MTPEHLGPRISDDRKTKKDGGSTQRFAFTQRTRMPSFNVTPKNGVICMLNIIAVANFVNQLVPTRPMNTNTLKPLLPRVLNTPLLCTAHDTNAVWTALVHSLCLLEVSSALAPHTVGADRSDKLQN
ncbi:unnamed protein product [Ectocarpus sp. 13 AM-2016]